VSRAAARLLALALVATSLTACGGGGSETAAPEPASQGVEGERERVTDLANVLQLRRDFEADAGKTRVLLLFSPT
jgi:hypothetical protein